MIKLYTIFSLWLSIYTYTDHIIFVLNTFLKMRFFRDILWVMKVGHPVYVYMNICTFSGIYNDNYTVYPYLQTRNYKYIINTPILYRQLTCSMPHPF